MAEVGDLQLIRPESDPPKQPDPLTLQEKVKREATKVETIAELERRSFSQDIQERKRYASNIFKLVVLWLVGVFVLLAGSAVAKPWGMALSEPVLLAVIGGTTVNVLGLFVIVTNYLFPKRRLGTRRRSKAERQPARGQISRRSPD